jgi:YidC/Oxa1 family membrane protein insertase
VLNFIYYPVSFILWAWHEAFSFLLPGDGWAGGIAWTLSVVFLVFTLRAILYKPFVSQVRSMRKMQEFQPELQKVRKKYANDKQKQAAEMQRLQREHGVNPVAGCLPVFVQVPVFIGLFHVLRSFGPVNAQGIPVNLDGSIRTQNYFFDQAGVQSFNNASLFGAKLGSWVTQGPTELAAAGTTITNMIIVMIPLMIAAGIFTHITARHSVARQVASGQGMDNPQTAIMQKLMLYVFPIGVVVGAPFLPLAILIYWVSNNLWTLGQQYVVYRRIDAEQAEKRDQAAANRQALAPKVGQKPVRPEQVRPTDKDADAEADAGTDAAAPPAKKPGAKPVTRKPRTPASPGSRPRPNGSAPSVGGGSGENGAGSASRNGDGTARRTGGDSTTGARRPRKRR